MILHIVKRSDWQKALLEGSYRPESLTTEGFVHCSTAAQVLQTAQRYFAGQPDLLLLSIDEQKLEAPVRWEAPPHAVDQSFPHVYGPIPLQAVIQVDEFACQPDGSFRLPSLHQ